MTPPLTFQQIVLRLQQFWADRGCLIWQPYAEKVGAGTMNPATFLRALGPEPWNVGYVEPSYRPADGRYGENPNRMQYFYQYQVILKPDPGDPQEVYLDSLYALGVRREEHDIRFVEDSWEAPALGAWGLGWEVWLDGQEITQFTYFQQAGGFALDPVAVEITYGLERIAMALQSVRSVWEVDWDGRRAYGDVLLQAEVENCRYEFEFADVEALQRMYDLFEEEARRCLEADLVVPAHDYVLRCSHTFNLLDARGAIGVTERATFFRRMRDLSRQVAHAYLEQRKHMEYPWLDEERVTVADAQLTGAVAASGAEPTQPTTFLLEVGTEELPTGDLASALQQLEELAPAALGEARLEYDDLRVLGTPRRLVVLVENLSPRQTAVEEVVKGPPADVAFDAHGQPTRAAVGFARKQGVAVDRLERREIDGGEYAAVVQRREGHLASEVLIEILPSLVGGLRFQQSMRWNATNVAFSRPIRWLVALLGEEVVPFQFAGVTSGRMSRGSRPAGSPALEVPQAEAYLDLMRLHEITVDPQQRRSAISARAEVLAQSVGGRVLDDEELLDEVSNMVEQPTPLLGRFEQEYLWLPPEVLIAVMEKHQRYLPVVDEEGALLPYFVTVRNGGEEHLDVVRRGNEEVIRARFADADYFYREDTEQPLEGFLDRLGTLTFHEQLGSMLDKTRRLERLVPGLAEKLGLSQEETETAVRAAHLSKADLTTRMVVEFTSLQGVIGQTYALRSDEPPTVAQAILEHYLPRFAGDRLPETRSGLVVGMADRLDSLAGFFALGLSPTGSADPYGLRRSALGLVMSLIEAGLPFSVCEGLSLASGLLPVEASPESTEMASEFIVGRLRVALRERGFRYDVVEAVLAVRGDDPYRAYTGTVQLADWVERGDWPRILDNYARCVRIARGEEERLPLDPGLFAEPAEDALYSSWQEARARVEQDSAVDDFLSAFVPMVDVIDQFFAKESGVLVMAEDQALRENRLALLQHVAALADGIVDLSRLEGF